MVRVDAAGHVNGMTTLAEESVGFRWKAADKLMTNALFLIPFPNQLHVHIFVDREVIGAWLK